MQLDHASQRLIPTFEIFLAADDVGRSIIRIRSARAFPEKIVFDTTTPIAATVSSPLLAREDVRMNGR